MSRRFELEDADGRRTVEDGDFPLAIGGADGDLCVGELDETVAWLGLGAGDLFVQPADGHLLRIGGERVETSRWLRAGDTVDLGGASLWIESGDDVPRLRLSPSRRQVPTLVPPPRLENRGVRVEAPRQARPAGRPIEPITFEPARGATAARSGGGRRLGVPALLLAFLAGLGAVVFFLFTARSVAVEVTPAAAELAIHGGLGARLGPILGERYLLRPGRYSLVATQDGYRPLETAFEVGPEARQEHRFVLEKLPGVLKVAVRSAAPALEARSLDATLEVDGVALEGDTAELEPGDHSVRVTAPRHRDAEVAVEITGGGGVQELEVVLEPRWATVSVDSRPRGARLRVDGEDRGTTPASLELLEGVRVYTLTLAGHAPRRGSVEVVAGEDLAVGPVELRPSDGNLSLTSQPDGAAVRVAGVYRGETPLDLRLEPGREHVVRLEKRGFAGDKRQVRLGAGEAEALHVELERLLGTVRLELFPPDAEVRVNGEERTGSTLELAATVAHEIEVRREGYVPFTTEVTPLVGHEQSLEIRLETEGAAREREVRELTETSEGQKLELLEPGRFRMGASRREPGRRANETLREVELTRRYYLSAHEVTNAQFRRFRPEHRSGTAGDRSLELDDHPVVRVSWQDAAAYCNWLSLREGLEPAYVRQGELLVAKTTAPGEAPPSGYRLPTEAEWAWAARYPGGAEGSPVAEPLKYPWGDALPVPEGAGNYADRSAADLVSAVLGAYHDGFPATAPVDAFGPDRHGLYQLGGNVAEWMHDVYVVRAAMPGAVERDPSGPPSGDFHVIRGSSWMHSTITELRLSFRDYGDDPRADVGFRLARPVL